MLINLLRHVGVYRFYENYLKNQISKSNSPTHVALILDGNRRWAKSKFIPEWMGHFAGADIVDDLLDWSAELDIKIITLSLATDSITIIKFVLNPVEPTAPTITVPGNSRRN